ncbi:hypothetical protein [Sporosarcina sp. FA9]|uniref:hypothetical protein n=1 Tax=Sporosarcina sp. FA9 TaxID=3413030 RepID=UPI003F657A4C
MQNLVTLATSSSIVVIWGFFKINYVTERTLFNEVEINLLILEDAISYQKENNWSQPSFVTLRLEEVMDGLAKSRNIGAVSRTLSKRDIELLYYLSHGLLKYQRHPLDTLDSFSEISDSEKKNYEELGVKLLEVGFREQMQEDVNSNRNIGTFNHIDSILSQVEKLVEYI